MMDKGEKDVIMIILNIPRSFGSGDLRRYFTNFVESKRFKCFHFKRRPLQKLQSSIIKAIAGLDKLLPQSLIDGTSPTNCCLVTILKTDTQEFENLYQMKHWFGKNEVELDTMCHIAKVDSLLSCDIEVQSSMEFRPPRLMPNGNVGTSTNFFLEAINSCQMPSSLISKLGLDFPQSRARRYANVPPPCVEGKQVDSSTKSRRNLNFLNPKKLVTVTGTIETNLLKPSTNTSPDSFRIPSCSNASTNGETNDKYDIIVQMQRLFIIGNYTVNNCRK